MCCLWFVRHLQGRARFKYTKRWSQTKSPLQPLSKLLYYYYFYVFLCVCLVFYASPIPGVLRFPALAHLSTNQHSASSDMQLGFWRNAWEHGCDGRKALRSRCPNRNVYADWHIYRNINSAWDAAQNPRSQLFPLKKHKHATPQEGGFYLCKNKLVLMPLWTKELINKKGKEKHGDGPRHSSVFSLVMFLSSFRFVKQ